MFAAFSDLDSTNDLAAMLGPHIRDDFRHATGDTVRDVIGPVTAEPYQICLQRTAEGDIDVGTSNLPSPKAI